MSRRNLRVLATLTDTHIKEQREVTILDSTGEPVLAGQLLGAFGGWGYVALSLRISGLKCDIEPLPEDTAVVVGAA